MRQFLNTYRVRPAEIPIQNNSLRADVFSLCAIRVAHEPVNLLKAVLGTLSPLNSLNNSTSITTLEALASRYNAPRTSSQKKVHRALTEPMINWLRHSPFFILSSLTETGIDCSPRGDKPGEAFRVLNNHTIAIPDRRGNNRIDTLKNILIDPRIGLVFLIPGVAEALRIKGVASISIEPELLSTFRLDGDPPATVVLVSIEQAYVQNARATRAADLWNITSHLPLSQVPNAKELYES